MSFLLIVALFVFLVHLWTLATIGRGLFRMGRLTTVEPQLPVPPPMVSIIVPACNEAETISPALRTLLNQDYPNLEVIVINDRSTDDTAIRLGELQESEPHSFRTVTIRELPAGWLGKANALQEGAALAKGEILLFTDADVVMDQSVVSKAVTVLKRDNLDHLSLIFQATGGNWLLNGMILDAASGLLTMFKPWKAADVESGHAMGVGAFNMVKKEVYEEIGGHSTIAMHPIDDIMLGKLIKETGHRQACMLGEKMVRVAWYNTPGEMIDGLMKNVFSVLHYRVWLALLAMATLFLLSVVPLLGLILASGFSQLFFGLTVLLKLVGLAAGTLLYRMPALAVLGGLVAPLMSIYIVGRAVVTTVMNGGIQWRGTFYSLEELRKSRKILL